jgi:hypothetical protein
VTMKSGAERARGGGDVGGVFCVGSWKIISVATLLVALTSGCDMFGQDSARCEQSVATVRQAIGFKDFASARTWREYTWKVCGDGAKATLDALDKELVVAEEAARTEAETTQKKNQALAQKRINAAQKMWRAFDGETPANKNEQTLSEARKSATRLEKDLTPTFALQLRKYNDGEYQKRLAALKR